MIEIRNIAGLIDQSGDIAAARATLPRGPRIGKADRKIMRRLAGEVAELAERPIRNEPQRAVRWVELAREEAERAWR